MDPIGGWADQFVRELEFVLQGEIQNEPYMGNISSEAQQEVHDPSFHQSLEELRRILLDDDEIDSGRVPMLNHVEHLTGDKKSSNSDGDYSFDRELPVPEVEPLNVAAVSYDHNRIDEAEHKQHVSLDCPLAEKLEYVIKSVLRAVGLDQHQVPFIGDTTREGESSFCKYSSKVTENDINYVLSLWGRDKIAFLPEEGKSKLSLLERISGWSVCMRPRKNPKDRDMRFTYTNDLVKKTYRSFIQVIHFIFYEKSQKEMERDKEETIPSIPENNLFRLPPETLEEIAGGKLCNLAENKYFLKTKKKRLRQ